MSPGNLALQFLKVLYFSSLVHSGPVVLTTDFFHFGQDLVVGTYHMDKKAVVYGVCEARTPGDIVCRVIRDIDPFDRNQEFNYCDFNLSSIFPNGEILAISVNLWGPNQVIFTYRDLNNDNFLCSNIHVRIISLPNCNVSTHNFVSDNRPDMRPQVFIIPYEKTLTVGFPNNKKCKGFCKVTVYRDGKTTAPIKWFSNEFFVHTIESIENNPNGVIMIMIEPSLKTRYFLVLDEGRAEIGRVSRITELGWSATNNFISFCSGFTCATYYPNRQPRGGKSLRMNQKPSKFIGLYNMLDGSHLAFFCDNAPDSYYRVVKISPHGISEYQYDFTDLICTNTYNYMNAKFYRVGHTYYCLSLFHSVYNEDGKIKYSNVCFYIPYTID